jgi:predicted acylesterase/phospholipase RssA
MPAPAAVGVRPIWPDSPSQLVVDAVHASMSIPFTTSYYQPARLTDADGRDCWLIDGALLSRFPIDMFDTQPGLEPRWPTFGIKLSAAPGPVTGVHDTVSMSRAMLNTMAGVYDRRHLDGPAAAARTIGVDTGRVRATDFSPDQDIQDLLFRKGREAARRFLDGAPGLPAWWDWEAYKRTYRSAGRRDERYHTRDQRDQADPDDPSTGTGYRGKRRCEHDRRIGERGRGDQPCPLRHQSVLRHR